LQEVYLIGTPGGIFKGALSPDKNAGIFDGRCSMFRVNFEKM